MKYVVIANFSVHEPQEPDASGKRPPLVRRYRKGMVVDEADIPGGHTAKDWEAKGLVKKPT